MSRSGRLRPSVMAESRVPDAVQRGALAERCTADPGPPQTGTIPVLQRTTTRESAPCCAAPGTRGHDFCPSYLFSSAAVAFADKSAISWRAPSPPLGRGRG